MADGLRQLGDAASSAVTRSPPVDVIIRGTGREVREYRRFNTTLTGDISSTGSMLTLWDPSEGRRYRLRGGVISAMFTTKGTGTGVDHLMLLDDGATLSEDCLVDLGAFSRDAPAGYVICEHFVFDFHEGSLGSARNAVVRVGANATIGSGVIRVAGQVWGEEDIR
jgi:hypothetical protein